MRVSQQVTIDAPPGAVWELIGAPLMYPRFLRDIRRWEAIQGDDDGRPRYRIEVRVGDVELGATVEFTRSIAPRELSWQSVEGIEHSGHWHVSEQHEGRCRVSLELNYRAPEGLLGTVADAAALPLLRSGARESLVRLMAIVEGHPPARGTLAKQLAQSAREIGWDASAFARSGMIAPARPDRLVRAAWELTQWDATLAAGCTIAATMHPDEPALIDDRGRWTFGEVHQRTNALVRELNGRGVEPGDRVAILCRNHERVAEAIVAASKLGADIVLLNAGLSARQLRELLKRERPRSDPRRRTSEAVKIRGVLRFVAWHDRGPVSATTLDELIAAGDPSDLPPPARHGHVVILTSGTTGPPKGATRPESDHLGVPLALIDRIPLRSRQVTLIGLATVPFLGLPALRARARGVRDGRAAAALRSRGRAGLRGT